MTATALTAVVQFRHRSIAGLVHDPITQVADDTWGDVTGTITSRRIYGRGSSTRLALGITDAQGATVVVTVAPHTLTMTPDFLTVRGAVVQVRGLVRRLDGIPPIITATGFAPADVDLAA